MGPRKRVLNPFALAGDLAAAFTKGPAAIVLGDTRDQLRREFVDLKRRAGLRLRARDAAAVRTALLGIESSRRYVLGYEHIYTHVAARLSPDTLERLGDGAIFPLSREVIALAKSFDLARIPRTVAFLDEATRVSPADAGQRDFRRRWDDALSEDGPGEYERFTGAAWRLILTVAAKNPVHVLPAATASIPRVETFITTTAASGRNFYDVLVDAPAFLRVMVYAADANHEGHALDGAHVPYSHAASEIFSRALDRYLTRVLGDAGARQHPLFSENRARVKRDDPVDVGASHARTIF